MPNETIELSRVIPATPERLYAAWLDPRTHSAMTGGKATVESREVGGRFTAWDGYIDGSHVALEPGRRILQSWRSDDFPPDAVDSLVEVLFEAAPGGTRVTIRHGDIPFGQGASYLNGWDEHYLEPMSRYFAAEARRAGRKPAAGAAKRKAAAPKKRAAAPKKKRAGPAKKKAAAPKKKAAAPKKKAAAPKKKAAPKQRAARRAAARSRRPARR